MQKYQFLQTPQHQPIIINYGQLGPCQLLRHRKSNKLFALQPSSKAEALKDIVQLKKLNHPNIIKIIDHFDYDESTLLIFEFMANGDLLTKIRCKQIKLNKAITIFKGICDAVRYIHKHKMIHRNLKAQTILLDAQMKPKIVDFQLSTQLKKRKTLCGCYSYMAPQLLLRNQYDQTVDIWALGTILYEMLYGVLPFQGQNQYEVLSKISNFQLYTKKLVKGSSDELIRHILNVDPKLRPTISQILNHPFLKQNQTPNKKKIEKIQHRILANSKINYQKINNYIDSNRNSITDDIVIPKKSKQQTNELFNLTRVKSKSLFQKLKTSVSNKIDAIFDNQKVDQNPHYNFIIKL